MRAHSTLLFKYGGNAMVDEGLQKKVIRAISKLKDQGHRIAVVHGGGPFIKKALDEAKITSEFVEGQRITTTEAIGHVEMALKGKVNGKLVSLLNGCGQKAVGLSGKDGKMVIGRKRIYKVRENGQNREVDMGQVADVESVDTSLLDHLMDHDFIPIIACLATDEEGNDFNVNADMMSGHIAGALKVDEYIVLTDVDGLLMEADKPESIIREITTKGIHELKDQEIITGGMIPKVLSCEIALTKGAGSARIINGTKPELIESLGKEDHFGTRIIAK